MLSIEHLLPRLSFEDTDSTMSARFLFGFFKFFSPVYAIVKLTTVLVFQTIQSICKETSIKCLSQNHNDVLMPNTDIEPAAR